MQHTPPIPSAEREQAIQLLQTLYHTKRELWKVLVSDKDWKKGLFPGALFLEDDPRFNFWFDDLLKTIRVPWERIENG